jgi:crotonobetainyl-CoA:carnitine CoA-transferase CaiB-like acyl-CoA transferase
LFQLLQDKIQTHNAEELLKTLAKDFVPAGKVKALDEVFADQEAAELIRKETNDGIATQRVTSIAFKWE